MAADRQSAAEFDGRIESGFPAGRPLKQDLTTLEWFYRKDEGPNGS